MAVPNPALTFGACPGTRRNYGVVVPFETVKPVTRRKRQTAVAISGDALPRSCQEKASHADPSGRIQAVVLGCIRARETADFAAIFQDGADVHFRLAGSQSRQNDRTSKSSRSRLGIAGILPCDIGPGKAVRNRNRSTLL